MEGRVERLSPRALGRFGPRPELLLIGPGGDAAEVLAESVGPNTLPMVGYRSSVEPAVDPAPFVQPALANPSRFKPPKSLPHDLRSLSLDAAKRVDTTKPSRWPSQQATAWLEETAERHPFYRRAHDRNARRVLEEAFSAAGNPLPLADEEVTVVCVTNRPSNLEELVANYQRQRYPHRKLLVITNSDEFDEETVASRLETVPDCARIHIAERHSLGHCLNIALDTCTSRFMAKVDDDDWYGPDYLGDMLIAHRFAGAAVVGKHSYYAYVEETDQTVLRFPGREFEYTSFVAGGTLVVDVPRVSGIRFTDRTIGEDSGFLATCQRAGLDVYAADRFNYLQVRGRENTWRVNLTDYLEKTVPLAKGRAYELAEI